MNLNSKTIISTLLILLCGICADGHAKSKKHKNKNKHTETQVRYEPVQPKTETPITQVKEVAIETPKVIIEKPAPVQEVTVITYQPNHEEKIGKEEVKQEEIVQEVVVQEEIVQEVAVQEEIVQEVVVDSMCESEALEDHIAENTNESIESNT